jgi:hypothetical protein
MLDSADDGRSRSGQSTPSGEDDGWVKEKGQRPNTLEYIVILMDTSDVLV